MSRKLTSGADFPANYRGRLIRLAQVTTDTATHYFANQAVTFGDNPYKPWLVADEPIRRFRSLRVDAATLTLQNASKQMETLIFAEKFEGAAVKIFDLLFDLETPDTVELIRGVLTDRQMSEATVEWSIVPTWDSTTIDSPRRVDSRTCTFRFKGAECGYDPGIHAGSFTTCPKDFAACTERERTAKFPGFIHITNDLQRVFPPPPEIGTGGNPGGSGPGNSLNVS